MAGDRARVSYDPTRQWRGTVAQQGRVTVDADLNEGATISDERDRLTTLDVVGTVGTPDGGYAVTAFPAGSAPPDTPGDLQFSVGTLYLGGERLELEQTVTYGTQPDWLDHSTDPLWVPVAVPPETSDPAVTELIALHAIEVEVSATEDPALADVALGGPDTMQRRRILQRFVRQIVKAGDCDAAWTEFVGFAGTEGLGFDPKSMRLLSMTSLQVNFTNTVGQSGPCEPVATGGYLGAENQLIRVMVTGVDEKGSPTIVWGFDNASFLYRLTAATYDSGSDTTTVTLASSPVDNFHFPRLGQAVELLRDAAQLTASDYIASPAGSVSTLATAYDPTQMTLVIAGQPPADYLANTPQLYLRVWEQTATAPPGVATALGDTGVAVTLTTTGKSFNIGDFWTFALRPINPSIVYPQRYLDSPQPPEGPRIWVCPLALVSWPNGQLVKNPKPTVMNCVPPFRNLVKLTDTTGCGCTVQIGPSDVADGAELASFVARYAGRGEVAFCLDPGTYTLSEPIMLGKRFGLDGVTLRGCGDGVVLAAPQSPGPQFSLGLIVVEDGTRITVEGIDLSLPLVGFSPSSDAFTALPLANQQLMAAFSAGLQLSFGISASDQNSFITVRDCRFLYPDPGTSNVFGAGIYATGVMANFELTGCSFNGLMQQPDVSPFNDLAIGNQTNPPYPLTFGYLHVPAGDIAEVGDTTANVLLSDAVIERCLFQAVTVPVLVMARLGALRFNLDTVRDCYGGFWLVSVADDSTINIFDVYAVGNTGFYHLIAQAGLAAILDRIFVMASALGRVLPTTPPSDGSRLIGRVIIPLADEQRARAETALAMAYRSAAARPGPAAAPGQPAPAKPTGKAAAAQAAAGAAQAAEALPGDIPADFHFIFNPNFFVPTALIPTAETGYGLLLRLDVSDCQVDAVVASSYSGAGLMVADFTQSLSSALVHGCRLRTRFPMGESAICYAVAEATVTGNVIANEVVPPAEPNRDNPDSYSFTMLAGAPPYGVPAVAITGNVFIDPTLLPQRGANIPAPLNDWDILNTVIAFVATPVVDSISPTAGLPDGGTSVTISGSGFVSAATVSFGGSSASSFTITDDSTITAVSPAGSGTVDIVVTSSTGISSATSVNDQFTYEVPPPVPVPVPVPRPIRTAAAETGEAEGAPGAAAEAAPEAEADAAPEAEASPKTPRQTSKISSTGITRPMKRPDMPTPPPTEQ